MLGIFGRDYISCWIPLMNFENSYIIPVVSFRAGGSTCHGTFPLVTILTCTICWKRLSLQRGFVMVRVAKNYLQFIPVRHPWSPFGMEAQVVTELPLLVTILMLEATEFTEVCVSQQGADPQCSLMPDFIRRSPLPETGHRRSTTARRTEPRPQQQLWPK